MEKEEITKENEVQDGVQSKKGNDQINDSIGLARQEFRDSEEKELTPP